MKFINVSGLVGTTPQSSVQTIPGMLVVVEIRTVNRRVIMKSMLFVPRKFTVSLVV